MKCLFFTLWSIICVASCLPNVSLAETSLDIKFAHYDRVFTSSSRDRTQTGSGLRLFHKQDLIDRKLELKLGFYAAQKWASTGLVTEDLLARSGDQVTGFNKLGEVSLQYTPIKGLSVKVGRVQHQSLLLSSKTRLLPSTFEGINVQASIGSASIFASHYRKWSRRANSSFTSFSTELSEPIKHLSIFGIVHKSQSIEFKAEALHSQDYLTKFGLETLIRWPLNANNSITTKGGLFTSQDAGALFVDGANSTLDSSAVQGLSNANQRIKHNGLGAFIDARIIVKKPRTTHTISIAHARFGAAWIEDNFADDHGQSPFPTSTMGPELTNDSERVWLFRYTQAQTEGLLSGLKTSFGVAKGYGTKTTNNSGSGIGKESWYEADFRYTPHWNKQISARLRYRDYNGEGAMGIAGVKEDREETRFTLDYSIKF